MKFDAKYNNAVYIESNDKRAIIALKEKGKAYEGENINRQRIIVYKVDDGLVCGDKLRCDFVIYTKLSDNLYLIELKGSDYSHALRQIISTVNILLAENMEISVNSVYCRIVLSKVRVPQLRPTEETILKRILKQKNGMFREEYIKRGSIKMKEIID